MAKFKFHMSNLDGLIVIEPNVLGDRRGFFMETYNKEEFENNGLIVNFVQDNHSKSRKGVLRGLHYQTNHPQGKLVRILKGAVYDVAVDLRGSSPTYGKSYGIELSEENKKMLYIPIGFAHGFLTLYDDTDLFYKVTDYYYAEYDAGILWNDSDLNIKWPLNEYGISKPFLSDKDSHLPLLKDITSPFN